MNEPSEITTPLGSGRAPADSRPGAPESDARPDEAYETAGHGRRARRDGEPEIGPEWATLQRLALRQLDRFVGFEPKVLRGDSARAIHDIRVASRRLQELLDLLYPAPRLRGIQKLRRKIRRSRRALSEVRNCDVSLARIDKTLGRKRTARREAWEVVRDYLAERRAKTAAKALRRFSKLNLAAFYVRLKEYLVSEASEMNAPGAAHSASDASPQVIAFPDERAGQRLQRRLAESLEREWQAFEARLAESHRDRSADLLHRARIATKRVRYLVEVAHQFQVAGSGEALAGLRRLQRCLGDWHDLEVLEQRMLEMVARQEFLRQRLSTAMEVERLVVRGRAAKRRLEEKYLLMTLDAGEAGSGEYQRLAHWVAGFLSSPAA